MKLLTSCPTSKLSNNVLINRIQNKADKYSELTLHIVLATFPQSEEKKFNKSIVKDFYGKYRENAADYFIDSKTNPLYSKKEKSTKILYNPLRYFMLGNYDMAYISLIDNFKFAQRVFEPQLSVSKDDDDEDVHLFPPHTFQSFSGISCDSTDILKKLFSEHLSGRKHYFLAITNLKLNNGFLIGNGESYLTSVTDLIREKICKINEDISEENSKVQYTLMQSFSWFELSLIIFANDPSHISRIVKSLRSSAIRELENSKEIIENSLYNGIFTDDDKAERIANANVFADTHTDFGINADLIELDIKDEYVQTFYKKKIALDTEVEWQVKPGHMHLLLPLLQSKAAHLFNFEKRFLLAGKNDYMISNKEENINFNVDLLRLILKKDTKFYLHVRKIRTRVYFRDEEFKTKEAKRGVLDLHSELLTMGVKICDFTELDHKLKSLKISRQIRSKILKIFSNYNNGIQDIILFPFFMDFKIFINSLITMIVVPADRLTSKFTNPGTYIPDLHVSDLEMELMNVITIFQEGYNIRMLNGYQFEDINDFDLDFNSSIQQLLSVYSTLAIEIGNLFYKREYNYGPVVQLNLKDTVSNYISINYYVHHLTSPEFVFATLTKEIINFLYMDDPILDEILKNYKNEIQQYSCKSMVLKNLLNADLININYLINDALRFIISFDIDFELFNYWHWTYNLQNASLYDETGIFNEERFQSELARVLFINYFFGCDKESLICPLPELYTYWDRHLPKMKTAIQELCEFMERSKSSLTSSIMDHLLRKMDLSIAYTEKEVFLEEPTLSQGLEFILKLQKKYQPTDLKGTIINRIAKKIRIYQLLDEGNPDNIIPTDSVIYLQWYMLNYLKAIYELNGKKIILLRRNWYDGKPLESFLSNNSGEGYGHLYSVDQTGGLFFDNISALNAYFKLSTLVIKDIWTFSLKRKKKFMLKNLSTP